MDKNLGKKKYRLRTSLALTIPLVYPLIALLMIGLLVLPVSTVGDNPIYALVVNCIAGLLFIFMLIQIFRCHIMFYENGMEIVTTFGRKVIMRDDITVIHWDKPGQYEGTKRTVVRKTNEIAEVMIRGGKMIKISDAVYKNVAKIVGDWQAEYNIPREY
jgi:hypothetical protein